MEPERLGLVGETEPDDHRAMTCIVARIDPICDVATSLEGSDDPDATTDISNSEVATVFSAGDDALRPSGTDEPMSFSGTQSAMRSEASRCGMSGIDVLAGPARIAASTRIKVSEEHDVPVGDSTTPHGLDSTRFFDNADSKLPPDDVRMRDVFKGLLANMKEALGIPDVLGDIYVALAEQVSKVAGPSATEITPPESFDGADIDVEGVAPKEGVGDEDVA
ncbi:hypothetical protein AALP_AAs62559U000100 [Arabis alpina]|uniref:Uncharacterized protein n=2 Tax=Arabis alpina TaxID=50452 RepID=A0A087FWI6_ARAAL|nr:hypothetical protein AALP_AAs62559U000100 [Arabis alpina]